MGWLASVMRIAPKPPNEAARLKKLAGYDILDTGPEDVFERVTRLAARLFKAPISAISLVDDNRQWFKARYGLDIRETARDVAFCAHTILKDEVMVVPDAAKDPRFAGNPLVLEQPHIRFYAAAPLTTQDGFNLGTLCVIDRTPRDISAEEKDSLADLARLVVQALELRRLVSLDPVTQLPNRQFFEDHLDREHKRALRTGGSLAVVVLALDRFAAVVRAFGEAIGDEILQNVTQLLRGQLRDSDLIVRYGVEQFAVLLPDTDRHGADLVAEHLRHELEFASFLTEKGEVQVTASIGIALCDPKTETIDRTLARALETIRAAEAEGGNRVGGSELEAR
jgi:diguanylate cyclase (GGDEF)-like protein